MSDSATKPVDLPPVEALRSPSHTPLLLTTNAGLEPVVAAELRERAEQAGQTLGRIDEAPFGSGGYVLFDSPATAEQCLELARTLRSIHHVLSPLYAFSLPESRDAQLAVIRATVATLDVAALTTARSFRVTARRHGDHNFRSVDVQQAVGGPLQRRYGTAVNLENFDAEVRVDVQHNRCLLGIMHTRTSLSRRLEHLSRPRAALKPNVAYALLRFAEVPTGPETVLDPYCGSGTVLWEAQKLWPGARLVGSDWAAESISVARSNARLQGARANVELFQADGRDLGGLLPGQHVDLVVTNPPFGVKHGRGMDFHRFYRTMLEQLHSLLIPGGRAVLLIFKRKALTSALHDMRGFAIRREHRIEVGGIYPRVVVLDRK